MRVDGWNPTISAYFAGGQLPVRHQPLHDLLLDERQLRGGTTAERSHRARARSLRG